MHENLVIFDCDGVLVDSEFIASRIFSEALSHYGYQISSEECLKRFTGVDENTCREIIMKETGLPIPEDYWALQKSKLLSAFESDLKPLLDPILNILNTFKISRCVASNSSRSHVLHSLKITDQLKYFSDNSIFNASQVAKPKPAADLFLFAAKEMGVKPENCVVIEDSSIGAEAAVAAGMQVILFVGGGNAQFDWYQTQMAKHQKPMVSTCHELLYEIQQAFQSDFCQFIRERNIALV